MANHNSEGSFRCNSHAPRPIAELVAKLYTRRLSVAKRKKPRRRKIKAAIRRQLDYLQRNLDAIDALIASGASLSGMKTHWWHKLLVISELHRQQTILLHAKTRSIPDRIVNLVQRQVRPIVRGKARAAVEFGAKISVSVQNSFPFLHRISWDAYNESEDLIPQAKSISEITDAIPKGFVPIESTSTPRIATSARGTTFGCQAGD